MRLLVLAGFFPPVAGPGPQRMVRFLRHFAGQGARVTVVAPAVPSNPRVALDQTLLTQLPPGVDVQRTPGALPLPKSRSRLGAVYSRIEKHWQLPDHTAGWITECVQLANRLAQQERFDCLYTSGPPFSLHVAGRAVAERNGLPWVAEYRDPWVYRMGERYESRLHYWMSRRQERGVVNLATRVVMNTPVARRELLEQYPELGPEKVVCVTNTFDPEEFAGDVAERPGELQGKLLLVWVGRFLSAGQNSERNGAPQRNAVWRGIRQWLYHGGSYTPVPWDRSAYSPWLVIEALGQLRRERPEVSGEVRLVLAGQQGPGIAEAIREQANRLGLDEAVRLVGHLPRNEAVQLVRQADVLVLPCVERMDGGPSSVVPAKTYEYMAARKPILAMLPPGDAREFVEQSGLGRFPSGRGVADMAACLRALIDEYAAGGIRVSPDDAFIDSFRSDRLAGDAWNALCAAATDGTKPQSALQSRSERGWERQTATHS